MVPPGLHRVFTACGIRDASATLEGSRNPVEVVKCAIQMLHGGVSSLARTLTQWKSFSLFLYSAISTPSPEQQRDGSVSIQLKLEKS